MAWRTMDRYWFVLSNIGFNWIHAKISGYPIFMYPDEKDFPAKCETYLDKVATKSGLYW